MDVNETDFLAVSTQEWLQDGAKIGQWGVPSQKVFFWLEGFHAVK